jgi:hypothetical protein
MFVRGTGYCSETPCDVVAATLEAVKYNGAVVFGIAVCLALCLCRRCVAKKRKAQDESPASTHSDSDGKREVQPAQALPNDEEATTLLQKSSEPAAHADAVLTVDQSSETASLLGDSTQAPASDAAVGPAPAPAPAQETDVKPSGSDAIASESVEVVVVANNEERLKVLKALLDQGLVSQAGAYSAQPMRPCLAQLAATYLR